jgi:hypothetical protein
MNFLKFSETEYAYYTDSGVSTYMCAALPKNDDTPVKPRSSSTLDLPKKIISRERALLLYPVFDSDKYVALNVQLCTIDLIKTLLDSLRELSEDVALLKSDNACLNPKLINYMKKFVNL